MDNSWIESYLDALLNYGLSTEHLSSAASDAASDDPVNAEKNITAQYYLHQILDMDEAALWQAWSRVHATRFSDDKDARLQFLVWRVWFMKQQRLRVQLENAKLKEGVLDDELSSISSMDGEEFGDEEMPSLEHDGSAGLFRGVSEQLPTDAGESFETRVDKLYVILISLHGLVRGEAMELGRDADTGGQVSNIISFQCLRCCVGQVRGGIGT